MMRDVVKRILEELKQAKEAGEPDAWKLPIEKKDLWAITHALEEDDARIERHEADKERFRLLQDGERATYERLRQKYDGVPGVTRT